MQTFLIAYDLAVPATNKHAISSAIMMLGQAWARPLDQTWYLKADLDVGDIEGVLGGLLGDDDGLLVQRIDRDGDLAKTALRWFKRRTQPVAGIETNIVAFAPAQQSRPIEQDDFALAS